MKDIHYKRTETHDKNTRAFPVRMWKKVEFLFAIEYT